MKLRMSVASATPPLDLLDILVLGVWLIGIPGVGADGATSLTCERAVRSFDLPALDCGRRQASVREYWIGEIQVCQIKRARGECHLVVQMEYVRVGYRMSQWARMLGRGGLVE